MLSALPQFANARVLVVGDLMLDRYWHGATARISPEAPVPVVQVRDDEVRAGGAGNVALNTAVLGCTARLVGLVGEDEAGRLLAERLAARGVECRLQTVADAPTITKLRVISRHQQLIRLDFEERFAQRHAARVTAATHDALEGVQAMILSDYAKGTLSDTQALIGLARERGVPVIVDPKGHDFGRYRGATVVKPNLAEFEAIVGPCADDAELVERGTRLCADLELEALLITRSERGVTLIQRSQPAWHLPAHAREVFDVTGAGDTVSATLGCSLAAGLSLRDATALANLAASIVVGKLGTATVSVDELRAELNAHAPRPRGLIEAAEARDAIATARRLGERTVVAVGPFTPFDTQRLAYLEAAAARGDRLLALPLADDAGAGLLPALRIVDWVVAARDAAELHALLQTLQPDLIALPATHAGNMPQTTAEVVVLPGG
ncbi:D-glycero-beta-D-manno-heptose-7-phosphate kinase [Thauera propionica]|uniref:D-glycero-beta-D-manno-heptose-7-phosphate kinase n=1 Tax=Thauera propionica TaxID=2019431 RepID=A0A235F353_9RHOO|nr:D-glycero-beta-D-manno-heptose-7-phosphate kinase [Thauera propionica]OYD55690.1 D-glycero-beta-D-manno-heptose-7-phosphate kinase [Thauera propionica]